MAMYNTAISVHFGASSSLANGDTLSVSLGTVVDSSSSGIFTNNGSITGNSKAGINNSSRGNFTDNGTITGIDGFNNSTYGNLTINSGAVLASGSTTDGTTGITNSTYGTINVNGGTISSASRAYGIDNSTHGTINITSTVNNGTTSVGSVTNVGSVNNSTTATINATDGASFVNTGNINNTTHGTLLANGGTVSITGSVDNSTTGVISATSYGVLTIAGTVNNTTNGTISASDHSILNIGTIRDVSIGTLVGTVALSNHSTANIGSISSNDKVSFSGGNNLLNLGKQQDLSALPPVSGFSDTDKIDLDALPMSSDATISYSGTTLTVTSNGTTVTWNNFNVANGTTLTLEKEADGSLAIVCFLEGSMISTPSGLAAVEDLSQGDIVHVYDNNGTIAEARLSWSGMKHCVVRPELADDEAGYPVRILKNAIADGVPFKDLLITAEHCLFLEGKFVPARMLVNGRSIFFDKSFTSYNYYHIETDKHSVIMADGVLTESYLDTGNRASFRQSGKVISIGGTTRNLTWSDAAAPLEVSRSFVEPLSHQFALRAEQAGLDHQAPAVTLTYDANLHLETEKGKVIRPARVSNDHVMFMVQTGNEHVRIVSNASRPADTVGPFVDDRRNLGVLIGEVALFEKNKWHAITEHLTDEVLLGWHPIEASDMRWTSGNALLPLKGLLPNGIVLLSIQIKAAGPYVVADETASYAVNEA